MADVPLIYKPTSLVTYTDTDNGQYNLVNGAAVSSVGLSQSIPITHIDGEDLDILISFPFIQGSQNNTSMIFEVWSNKTLGDEQLLVSGEYLISNDEQSLQTTTIVPKNSFLTSGTKLVEIYLGAVLNQGNIQITNDYNAQVAVFRTKHFRDTIV